MPEREIWFPIADGHYVGTESSTQFPLYTRGNVGEVFPQVMFPLSFSIGWHHSVAAWCAAQRAVGLLRPSEYEHDYGALTAVFGGYGYLNLSVSRVAASRTPGVSADTFDAQAFGISDAPPHVPSKSDRYLSGSAAIVRFGLRTLRLKSLPGLDLDERRAHAWLDAMEPFETMTDKQLLQKVRDAQPFVSELFEHHLIVSYQAGVPTGLLAAMCEKKLGDPTLLTRLIGGAGQVQSAGPAASLWRLGRMVAASPTLSHLFGHGVGGLSARLASEPSASEFNASFGEFLTEYGSRGPNEWETGCDTWGTNPEIAYALVDRMRKADASHDPDLRQDALGADRDAAIAAADAKLSRSQRKRLRRLVASAHLLSQGREQAKTTIVKVIHGARLMSREIDRRCVARSGGQPLDLWFVTADELDDYVENPAAYAEKIRERRRMRDLLSTRIPPFVVDGMPPPFETWERRDAASATRVTVGQTFTGIAACAGKARGRARIITDPGAPGDLGPGDVLVAPLTDPAWTPLFVPAEAVVVNVGALMSHAAIVSRELGIPCVVSVNDATRVIPNGALIEVDGTAGTVTILELA